MSARCRPSEWPLSVRMLDVVRQNDPFPWGCLGKELVSVSILLYCEACLYWYYSFLLHIHSLSPVYSTNKHFRQWPLGGVRRICLSHQVWQENMVTMTVLWQWFGGFGVFQESFVVNQCCLLTFCTALHWHYPEISKGCLLFQYYSHGLLSLLSLESTVSVVVCMDV